MECLNTNKYVHMIFIHSKATSNPILASKIIQNKNKWKTTCNETENLSLNTEHPEPAKCTANMRMKDAKCRKKNIYTAPAANAKVKKKTTKIRTYTSKRVEA